jgi:DNA polymerase-3 subunit gamma/tau
MSYQALARKWRPQSFSDIIGQQAVVRTLQNAIEQNRIHHAYLFSGVRGVGKTTTARIFAKALNCQNGPKPEPCNECTICREITEGIDMDVREIDAATYSKAEDVRDLRELMQFQPVRDRRRIFIIDEVHSLSGQAWNALLKQIEEPPPHVIFMMATTEMHKVPATILSRVQRLAMRKITGVEVVDRLEEICRGESITFDHDALEMVARRGEGSVRDSISLLDQVIAFSGNSLTLVDVSSILGLADSGAFTQIVDAVTAGDNPRILQLIEELAISGRDFKLLYRDLLSYLRNLLLLASGADETLIKADPDEMTSMLGLRERLSANDLLRIINILLQDEDVVVRSESQRLAVEIALLKCAMLPRLQAIETALASGQPTAAPARPAGSAPAPRAAAATPAPPAQAATGGTIDQIIARVDDERRLAASYLRQARKASLDGDTVVFEFDAAETFSADYLSDEDQVRFIEKVAAEIVGHSVSVKIGVGAKAESARPKKSNTVTDDPVIQNLQKHLGGEVVRQNGKTK